MWDIVVNPVSGSRSAPDFVARHVVPLLTALGHSFRLHTTAGVRDASRIGRDLDANARIILAGGDGTAQELVDGALGRGGEWRIAVVPMGTANALFSSLFPPDSPPVEASKELEAHLPSDPETRRNLSSLILALSDKSPLRLPITLTHLPNTPPIPALIVTSTCLHAALLADAESLRDTVPGLDRFKMAASQNIEVFFEADVHLLPGPGGVKQWDPVAGEWSAPFTTGGNGETNGEGGEGDSAGEILLRGPFAYLVSATTTPRLEPTFVIVPTLQHREEGSMDIVILRPARDPRVRETKEEEKGAVWSRRAMEVLNAAYQDGRHIKLLFTRDTPPADPDEDDGRTVEARPGDKRADVVVETFRCGGFRWTPEGGTKSRLVCADGALHTTPEGASAEARVLADDGLGEFYVWG